MNHDELFKDDEKYLEGTQNWFIRMYFYCSNGLGILNEFRNLFLGIVAVYIASKLDNLWVAVLMFIVCVIILTVTGYYRVHRVAKVLEWVSMRFSTTFGIRTFNYTQATYEMLVEIRDLLKEKNLK